MKRPDLLLIAFLILPLCEAEAARITQPKQTYKNHVAVPLLMASFIPNNNIDEPTLAGPATTVFEGDDRPFTSVPASARTREQVTVIPSVTASQTGLKAGTIERFVGRSFQYDKASSLDPATADALNPSGKLTQAAKADQNLGDGNLKIAEGTASNESMEVFVDRVGERKLTVTMKGSVANPLVFAARLLNCSIAWNFVVTVDGTNKSQPTYSISGTRVNYPAYEAYLGRQEIHRFDPVLNGTDATFLCLPQAQFKPTPGGPIE